MGMPVKVQEAYERGDFVAIRRMRKKSTDTKRIKKQLADKRRDEQEAIDDLFRRRNEFDMFLNARQRNDHLLPEE